MSENVIAGAPVALGTGATSKRALRLGWWLTVCTGCLGAALLACHLLWSTTTHDPRAILPPAGETLPGEAPFRFAVLGDNRGNMSVFEDILAGVKREDVRFIIHTGDLVSRCSPENFRWLLHELGEENLDVPFCATPGNHDLVDGPEDAVARASEYTRAFGPRQYWFACANTLLVAFDDADGHCTAEDLRWLDDTLARLRSRYTACFVYMHVPPRDPRPGKSHALEEGSAELIRVLKKHRVSAVLAGHIHACLEDELDGIPVYITGGAGARLVEEAKGYHCLICTVRRDGSLDMQTRYVPAQADTDHLEYVWWTKFPGNAVLFLGTGLLATAAVLGGAGWLRRGPRR